MNKKLFLSLAILIGMAEASFGQDGIVKVDGGLLQGVVTENPAVTVFKGIPYAAPPVGELRWALPQPVVPWEGIKVADTFGSPSVQRGRQPGSFYYLEFQLEPLPPTSEDCLFLNIWAPTEALRHNDSKLPVAMWIHGGGLGGGCGGDAAFDGEAWVERGVILVTINYRLGSLGFLSHPDLSAENPYGASGNQGIYDQLAALKWLHANIEAFGGDPDNITVFGQSAGARSTKTLLMSPLTKGLISRAIIQSGTYLSPKPFEENAERSKAAMDAAGFDSLEKMRNATTDELSSVRTGMGGFVIDNNLLFKEFEQAAADGDVPDIPIMIGSNADDVEGMDAQVDEFCKIRAAQGKPVYGYFFKRNLPGDDNPGSFHSAELWYMFHTLGRSWRPFTEADYALSEKMMDFWTNFAKYGNPNGKDTEGEWKLYTENEPYKEIFDVE